MKVTIKGLTEATITINSLGITLRGYNAQKNSFPTNIARGIEIDSTEIQRELEGLVKAGLIELIEEKEVIIPSPTLSVPELEIPVSEIDNGQDVFAEEAKRMGISVEDEVSEPEVAENNSSPEEPGQPDTKSTASGLSQIEECENPDEMEEIEDEKPVVMTERGAARSDNMRVEIEDDSDRTKASMEAMAKLEEEEAERNEGWEDQVFIDRRIKEAEELTDKMGQDTVVVIQDRQTETRTMQHNAMDQADASKDAVIYDIEQQAKQAQEAKEAKEAKEAQNAEPATGKCSEYSDAFVDDVNDIPGANFVEW